MNKELSISSSARFAWLFDDQASRNDSWDRILMEQSGTKTVPSLGSIVPGWTLTFPSHPCINLSRCTGAERDKVLEAADMAAERVASMGKLVFHFEHGAGQIGSETGCGLDLAHLHTVPLDFDLVANAHQSSLGDVSWHEQELNTLNWQALPREYFIVWRSGTDRALVGTPKSPTSQFFRKLIANAVGCGHAWNYRAHEFRDNIEATIKCFE